jgi:hypothetical protein
MNTQTFNLRRFSGAFDVSLTPISPFLVSAMQEIVDVCNILGGIFTFSLLFASFSSSPVFGETDPMNCW